MTQIAEFVWSAVPVPSDWSDYRRHIHKPEVLLTRINTKTGYIKTRQMTLLRALLTAKRQQYQPRFFNCNFYIHHLKTTITL